MLCLLYRVDSSDSRARGLFPGASVPWFRFTSSIFSPAHIFERSPARPKRNTGTLNGIQPLRGLGALPSTSHPQKNTWCCDLRWTDAKGFDHKLISINLQRSTRLRIILQITDLNTTIFRSMKLCCPFFRKLNFDALVSSSKRHVAKRRRTFRIVATLSLKCLENLTYNFWWMFRGMLMESQEIL